MISLYGRTYAPNNAAVLESLFSGPTTPNGTYRKERGGIVLCDLQGKERAFIRKDGLGPVSIGRHDGKRFYMFSIASTDDLWLGTPESFTATREGAQAVARAIFAS